MGEGGQGGKKSWKTRKIIETDNIKQIVLLQPNISDTPFDQKSPQPPEEGVLNCHTHTEKKRKLQLFDWIGQVGRFSEEEKNYFSPK